MTALTLTEGFVCLLQHYLLAIMFISAPSEIKESEREIRTLILCPLEVYILVAR